MAHTFKDAPKMPRIGFAHRINRPSAGPIQSRKNDAHNDRRNVKRAIRRGEYED